jgi:hypothetical protein
MSIATTPAADVQPSVEIWGMTIAPAVGAFVKPDGWNCGGWLKPGLDGFCPFYLTTNNPIVKELAAIIAPTGRTLVRRDGCDWVRVRITHPGDGEADTTHYGYMRV